MQYLANWDLAKNELQNAVIQNLATAPANPKQGQIYYSTTDSTFYGWNGTTWIDLGQIFSNAAILAAITASYTVAEKTKLAGIEAGAQVNDVTSVAGKTGAVTLTKSDVGLSNVENKSSATIRDEITSNNVTTALGFTPVKNGGNTPELRYGTEAARPSATGSGLLYFTDTGKIFKDTATNVWTQMGGQDLPIASPTVLGGIKVGANLSVGVDGTLNANDNPASFIIKQESFTVTEGQTTFNLTKGTYKPGTDTLFWFLFGQKQSNDALIETSPTSFQITGGLDTGDELLVEYIELINADPYPVHANEHLTGGVDPIPKATTSADGLMAKEDKSKLDGVAANANNYSHPANHPASIITQDANNRFVTDTEKSTWNGKASTAVATTGANGLMSSTDKSKLDGISSGAQVNQNAFSNVKVGATTVAADNATDTLELVAGANIALTPDATNDKVTIAVSEDATHRFVTDTEKSTWNAKETTTEAQAKADAALASAKTYTDTKVAALVDASPATLDTLNELAAALGDDPNFATTVANNIGNKADKTRTITGGNGLTGGGDLTADRTLTLGTPGTLTPTTTNSVTSTSHTHDVATATQAEAEAGTIATKFMTPLQTKQSIAAYVAAYSLAKKATAVIGNGTATEIIVTHNLGTMDVTVLLRENASPYAQVMADMQVIDANNIKLLFGAAPTTSQYKVVITG